MKRSKTEKAIWQALESVDDPELYISLVDLGLIYDVSEKDGHVDVTMTLTTIGCPLFPVIEKDMKNAISDIDGVKNISISVVFDPPWSVDLMTEKGKAILGI